MTITVNTPDGGTASFPDDTPQDTIVSAMKAKFGGPDASSDSKPWLSLTGTDKVGEFVGKVADAFTGGFGASALDKLGIGQGPGGQTVAKQVEAAGKDIGPVGSAIADVTGYALGPGKLGVGANLARGAEALGAGSRLAAGLGGAGEAALATGAGDIGHGETPGWDVLAAGGLGGAFGAAAGKAVKSPPPVGGSIADLQAAKQAAIDAAENTKVGNLQPYQDFTAARGSLTPGAKSGITPAMKAKLDEVEQLIADNADLNAKDLWSMRKNINNAARSPEDTVAAKTVGDSLYNLAPQEISDASMAHARLKDAQWLTNTTKPSDLVSGAQSRLDNKQMLMDPTTTQIAMQNLANSAPSAFNQGARNLAGYGINHGIGLAGGHWVGGMLGESGLGSIIGAQAGLGPLNLGRAITNIGLNRGTTKARKAALQTILSNQLVTPDQYARLPGVYRNALPVLNAGGMAGAYGS